MMTDLEQKFLPENLPWISSLSCPVRSRRRVLLFGNTKSARLRLNNIPAKSGPGDEARGGHFTNTARSRKVGRIIETGTHQELLQKNGKYHDMVNLQMNHETVN